jgi:hypothetical protein
MNERRKVLHILTGATVAVALPSDAVAAAKKDRRLVGTWKLDRDRTLKAWACESESESARLRIENASAPQIVRFTATHMITEATSIPYAVVASDHSAVVIALQDGTGGTLQQHLFNESGYYLLNSYHVEFYVQVHG